MDRLEVMLALMGWGCSLYTLTFANETLPQSLAQTRDWWKACSKGLRRVRGGAFPYVYCIEGLHGDHRWHVHAVLRDADFSQDDVLRRWGGGHIEDVQPLLPDRQTAFRDRARYLTKERRDGLVIPKGVRQWVAAPMLYQALAPPEKRLVKSGSIRSPGELWNLVQSDKENPYGAYRYKSWIELP